MNNPPPPARRTDLDTVLAEMIAEADRSKTDPRKTQADRLRAEGAADALRNLRANLA